MVGWLDNLILQDTGHAVFLPKSGVPGGNEGQKKKKKGKKWRPLLKEIKSAELWR